MGRQRPQSKLHAMRCFAQPRATLSLAVVVFVAHVGATFAQNPQIRQRPSQPPDILLNCLADGTSRGYNDFAVWFKERVCGLEFTGATFYECQITESRIAWSQRYPDIRHWEINRLTGKLIWDKDGATGSYSCTRVTPENRKF